MRSYVGYIYDERTIAFVIVECDSNEIMHEKAGSNNMINVYTLHFEHISKRDAKAGSCTLVRIMKWMGCSCSLYANCSSGNGFCVFEPFVIFAIRKNYLANYVEKLQ